MNKIKIAPSILAADFTRLGEEIRKIEVGGADFIHVDVMDGHFVPNITIGIPIVEALSRITSLPLDVHLMIENPEVYIDDFINAGAENITFHIEATKHAHRLVQKIKSRGVKAGVALNPATPASMVEYLLRDLDLVLIMTVNPGFGGQEFIDNMIPKIKTLTKRGIDIEVDGGIGLNNVAEVVKAGANIIVAGTSIFNDPFPVDVIRKLREVAEKNIDI